MRAAGLVLAADADHPCTLQQINSLLSRGMSVPPHPTVEADMQRLQGLLNNVTLWEDKTRMIMESR